MATAQEIASSLTPIRREAVLALASAHSVGRGIDQHDWRMDVKRRIEGMDIEVKKLNVANDPLFEFYETPVEPVEFVCLTDLGAAVLTCIQKDVQP